MKKIVAFASAAALGLGLAACDSPQEEAAEETAEVMEDRGDALEDSGLINDAQEDAIDSRADNVEDAAEGDNDAMTQPVEDAVN